MLTVVALLLMAFSLCFSAMFFVVVCCSSGFCSCVGGCAGCGIVTACFCCGCSGLKYLSNALSNVLSSISFMSLVRELICSVEKPGMVWLLDAMVISSGLLKGSM